MMSLTRAQAIEELHEAETEHDVENFTDEQLVALYWEIKQEKLALLPETAEEKAEREAREAKAQELIRECVENGGDTCPYCGGGDVEHSEAVATSDWQDDVERWICLGESCDGRHFDIEYVVDRDFNGIRTDDDENETGEGTLHRPAPVPERTLADRSLAFLRRVDDATLPELREARKALTDYANDMGNKASARATARAWAKIIAK
jgi:hypothetical protein